MIKRLFDIVFSSIILIVSTPVLIIISLLILFVDGRPILFLQKRSGKNQIPFTFLKFRTMKNNQNMEELDRITPIGNFLRKTSLDEFPSFFNVLVGHMSVVGPRPLLERYLPRYNKYQIRRLEVKPGITGLAQINGRNNLLWNEKFTFDVEYVDDHSLILDLKIISSTIKQVLVARGVKTENQGIMPEFLSDDE